MVRKSLNCIRVDRPYKIQIPVYSGLSKKTSSNIAGIDDDGAQ